MRTRQALTLGTLLGLSCLGQLASGVLASRVHAQEGGVQVTLESVETRVGRPFSDTGLQVSGPVGADFGFAYIRPYWADQDFGLALPGAAGNFINAAGDPDGNFAFVPRLLFNYQITPDGWGVAASGELIDVSGSINRTLEVNGASANLNASINTKVATVNLLEATRTIYLAEWADGAHGPKHAHLVEHLGLEDSVVFFSIGLRYTSVEQVYKSSLQTPANQNSAFLNADQEFIGLGVTSSLQLSKPLNERLVFFLITRGSVLLGENVRTSQATTSIIGNPAASRVANLSDTRTEALPIGELELGLEWGTALTDPPALTGQHRGPLVFVRAGVLGQVYGNVGLLSAGAVAQDFSDQALYVVGVTLLVGIQR